ncbi:MAG TPA: GIY-YIG nuclease family protein [Chitinophagaceae bacterium]|jgi:putative endonuclease|nr:GIY-YIG nuclease family protein [Chitinophagaceae bacterium]
MFYVYILYSAKLNRYYTGSCESIVPRLQRHNLGTVTPTRSGKPWELKYFEDYHTRQEALNRELQIKKMKSRAYFEKLISQRGID